MGLFGNIFFIFGLVDYFVIVIAVEPHLKIKGMDNVYSVKMFLWYFLIIAFYSIASISFK